MVADRQALSWHLGYSTYEKFSEELKRHNDPVLAQYIAEQRTTRERSIHRFKVSTYEIVVDARSCTLKQLLDHKTELLSLSGTQADFILLGNWSDLNKRYSPTTDQYADLREIHAWLKGDSQFKFVELAKDANLRIEEILDSYANNHVPIRIFVEGDFKVSLKDLVSHLRLTENGLLGLVNEQDKRAFAVLNSALARARRSKGDVYQNISEQFGMKFVQKRTQITVADGLAGLKALMPPQARRAAVLIDPSYEDKTDYGKVIAGLKDALQRFATGTYALWYPQLARRESVELPDRLVKLGVANWLHVTLSTQPPATDGLGMTGSGLFIINPPWTLPQTLEDCLPWLADTLGIDGHGAFTLDWRIQ